jgi:hypothetical protein
VPASHSALSLPWGHQIIFLFLSRFLTFNSSIKASIIQNVIAIA